MKVTPQQFWAVEKIIIDRIVAYALLTGKTQEEAMEMLTFCTAPDDDYFTDEEFDEYQALIDGDTAEAQVELNELRERNEN